MSDVFISYASEDRELARRLAGQLEQRGWSVWWDREILPGRQYDQVIEEAIAASRCVVVLWTRSSVGSRWVRSEAAEALRRECLVPVFIEQVECPLEFRRVEAAQMIDWPAQAGEYDLLVRAIDSFAGASSRRARQSAEPSPVSPPRALGAWLPTVLGVLLALIHWWLTRLELVDEQIDVMLWPIWVAAVLLGLTITTWLRRARVWSVIVGVGLVVQAVGAGLVATRVLQSEWTPTLYALSAMVLALVVALTPLGRRFARLPGRKEAGGDATRP